MLIVSFVIVCSCEALHFSEKSATEAKRHLSSVSSMLFVVYFKFCCWMSAIKKIQEMRLSFLGSHLCS